MSKPLSVVSVIEKNNIASDTPYLVTLDIDVVDPALGTVVETLRVVRNTEPIVFEGNSYEPAVFDIELKQEAGMLNSVSLSMHDYSKAVQGRMQRYGGGVGFLVRVTVVNAGALHLPAEVSENFEVIGASAAGYVCAFTLGAENVLMRNFPRRRQTRDFCQWRYKDPNTCGYSGSMPSCDLSLGGPNGCRAHGNGLRFGAFPGVNSQDIRHG